MLKPALLLAPLLGGGCSLGSDTGEPPAEQDLAELTELEGVHHYVFSGLDVHFGCQMRWAASGVVSDEPCEACDAVFEVGFTFLDQSGDCDGGYGYPPGESYEQVLGFALEWEDQGPVVGPVEYGEIDWGSGSIIGPATADAEATVRSQDPYEVAWTYQWRDPWGYYYDHNWYGELVLR